MLYPRTEDRPPRCQGRQLPAGPQGLHGPGLPRGAHGLRHGPRRPQGRAPARARGHEALLGARVLRRELRHEGRRLGGRDLRLRTAIWQLSFPGRVRGAEEDAETEGRGVGVRGLRQEHAEESRKATAPCGCRDGPQLDQASRQKALLHGIDGSAETQRGLAHVNQKRRCPLRGEHPRGRELAPPGAAAAHERQASREEIDKAPLARGPEAVCHS
mmetsp:Transcript_83129/g.243734  ORF Transcript_83129/g.243734 Transcript_83129/m.243734 type:complete len:215 (-) Transcript_83129:1366-2010(-)